MNELQTTIKDLSGSIEDFKTRYDGRMDALEGTVNAIDTMLGRGHGGGSSSRGNGNSLSAEAREHCKVFNGWARTGNGENSLRGLELQASMHTESDPDGGFLVPVEMDKEIERLALQAVAMRRICKVIKKKGQYKKPVSQGGATGGWVGERDSRPETESPTLSMWEPPYKEIYANPSSTQVLLDDADFDVEAWLLEEITDVFNQKEGTGFISGNSVGQVSGILNYPTVANASWAWGKVGFITSGHASLLNDADALIDLQHSLKPLYRQNGVWLMNDTTLAVVRKLKDGDGNYIWRQGLEAGAPETLLGKPVEIDDNMPDIGAGAYPIAFGDFKRGYTIVDHARGVRMLRDPYTSKGKIYFYTTKRLAAGISNFQAIKLLKIAA